MQYFHKSFFKPRFSFQSVVTTDCFQKTGHYWPACASQLRKNAVIEINAVLALAANLRPGKKSQRKECGVAARFRGDRS